MDEYNYDDEFTQKYYDHYLMMFQLAVKKNQFDVIVVDAVNAKTHEYQPFYDFAKQVCFQSRNGVIYK